MEKTAISSPVYVDREKLQQAIKLVKPFNNDAAAIVEKGRRDEMKVVKITRDSITASSPAGSVKVTYDPHYASSHATEIVIESKRISDAIKGKKGDYIELVTMPGNRVQIDNSITIPQAATDKDIRYLDHSPDSSAAIPLSFKQFQTAIKNVIQFCSDNQIAPILTGVHFNIEGDKISLTATDRHRLSRYEYPITNSEQIKSSFTIPAEYLQPLTALKLQFDKMDMIHNSAANYTEIVIDGHIHLFLRHLDGTYPDASKIIENCRVYSDYMTLKTDALIDTLKQIKAAATNKKRPFILFDYKVDGGRADIKDFDETVTMRLYNVTDSAQQDYKFAINSNYLLEAAALIDADTIRLYRSGASNPFYITQQHGIAQHDILILPVKVPNE